MSSYIKRLIAKLIRQNTSCFVLIFLISGNLMTAQQDSHYAHYMYNMSVLNPAYTPEYSGILSVGALHRSQWVGLEGAPKTSNIFGNILFNEKMGAGISLTNDNIGDIVKETSIAADISYRIEVGRTTYLSFGMKVGVNIFNVIFDNDFTLEIQNDPNFLKDIDKIFPTVGAGFFINNEQYYVGLSIPNFLKGKHLDVFNGKYQGAEVLHTYLVGGYVFPINDKLKLKPSMMVRYVEGAPIVADVSMNMLYKNRFELGLSYRFRDSVSGLINFRVTPGLRIGYSYDYTTSNLVNFTSGTHEIFILYSLDISDRSNGFLKSPRFY